MIACSCGEHISLSYFKLMGTLFTLQEHYSVIEYIISFSILNTAL
jgi:hypothetical protein